MLSISKMQGYRTPRSSASIRTIQKISKQQNLLRSPDCFRNRGPQSPIILKKFTYQQPKPTTSCTRFSWAYLCSKGQKYSYRQSKQAYWRIFLGSRLHRLRSHFFNLDWLRIEKQKGILNPFIKTQDDFSPISQLIDKSVNPYDIEL